MSVYDEEMDLNTTYMVDYPPKIIPRTPIMTPDDDNCLIIGLERDDLKAKQDQKKYPDVLCPAEQEYYKELVKRVEKQHPDIAKRYMSKDIDPQPILNDIKDLKRTEYLYAYCDRNMPFMSVNLGRRAAALQTLRLPDDIDIPVTIQTSSYRNPGPKYYQSPKLSSLKPTKDDSEFIKKQRSILRVNTGMSTYTFNHGLLGKVILEKNPFGKPRKVPKCGRWREPFCYTYWI